MLYIKVLHSMNTRYDRWVQRVKCFMKFTDEICTATNTRIPSIYQVYQANQWK